ncbi:hypothetical protein AMTR_s00021p00144990 [Amborella trichopoda]|uniref:Transmembrane protein n=1 Tax=Amborella trichopoda TaxID=13333 RepID=W1PV96_AMBTC|nr:hypothetical protein AMTR_s00021p00144990 [Amborella trichopoda]
MNSGSLIIELVVDVAPWHFLEPKVYIKRQSCYGYFAIEEMGFSRVWVLFLIVICVGLIVKSNCRVIRELDLVRVIQGNDGKRLVPGGPDPEHHNQPPGPHS